MFWVAGHRELPIGTAELGVGKWELCGVLVRDGCCEVGLAGGVAALFKYWPGERMLQDAASLGATEPELLSARPYHAFSNLGGGSSGSVALTP